MIRLTPGDKAFYGMLNELATLLTSACSLLTDLCEHPDQHDPLVRLIREDETAADELTHKVTLRLGTSFIPALDANEIYDLARALDGTIDVVEDAAFRIEAFRLKKLIKLIGPRRESQCAFSTYKGYSPRLFQFH